MDANAPDSANDAGTDATALNGCNKTNYQDKTAMAAFEIDWGFQTEPPASCFKIKKGTKVTWKSDLSFHPLRAKGSVGGAPNPIPATAVRTGTSYEVTFADEGVFGYDCLAHGSMIGAIYVVP
jgi:plastocyanin